MAIVAKHSYIYENILPMAKDKLPAETVTEEHTPAGKTSTQTRSVKAAKGDTLTVHNSETGHDIRIAAEEAQKLVNRKPKQYSIVNTENKKDGEGGN